MSSFEIMLYITTFNTIFVILCFTYVYLKEKEYKKKRDIYTQIFETITEEIHFVKKNINEHKQQNAKEPKFDENKMKESIKRQTINILNEVLPSIIDSIQRIDKSFQDFKNTTHSKNHELEKKVKEYSSLSSHSGQIDNKQIIKLHKSGHTSEEIANKLAIPKSEIDLAIKMQNA